MSANGPLAQSVALQTLNLTVLGSNPRGSTFKPDPESVKARTGWTAAAHLRMCVEEAPGCTTYPRGRHHGAVRTAKPSLRSRADGEQQRQTGPVRGVALVTVRVGGSDGWRYRRFGAGQNPGYRLVRAFTGSDSIKETGLGPIPIQVVMRHTA